MSALRAEELLFSSQRMRSRYGWAMRLAATVHDPLAYQQTIGALRRYSLVKTGHSRDDDGDEETLNVHRLVQAVVRHRLDPDQKQHWATTALRLVCAAFPTDQSDPTAWPRYARLLPHGSEDSQAASVCGEVDRPPIT